MSKATSKHMDYEQYRRNIKNSADSITCSGTSEMCNSEEQHDEMFGTSTCDIFQNDYLKILPGNLNIFSKLNISQLQNVDPRLRDKVSVFLLRFAKILFSKKQLLDLNINLPLLVLNVLEDNSILIEWGFKDYKYGFSFDLSGDDSSWYLVANQKFQEGNISGKLMDQEVEIILLSILESVINNI